MAPDNKYYKSKNLKSVLQDVFEIFINVYRGGLHSPLPPGSG